MLNMIALASDEDAPAPPRSSLVHPSFRWQFDTTFGMEEGILRYERDNMTMPLSSRGADPNGWRNALNYFGWGSMGAGVYRVSAYASFDAAAKSAVRSIARDHKPVGVLAWGGVHAQYVTGYEVRGEDPRVGDNYTVLGVFLTDPLAGGYAMDTFIPYLVWRYGSPYVRFEAYWEADLYFLDPIDGFVGNREWRGKWVIVEAVR